MSVVRRHSRVRRRPRPRCARPRCRARAPRDHGRQPSPGRSRSGLPRRVLSRSGPPRNSVSASAPRPHSFPTLDAIRKGRGNRGPSSSVRRSVVNMHCQQCHSRPTPSSPARACPYRTVRESRFDPDVPMTAALSSGPHGDAQAAAASLVGGVDGSYYHLKHDPAGALTGHRTVR